MRTTPQPPTKLEQEALRASTIVDALDKGLTSAEVFEKFEQLDELPAEIVRDVLAPWTGPAPDPERLDAATRRAHGFPPPPLVLRPTRSLVPKSADELSPLERDQVRAAGLTWDGLDLPAASRLDASGSESSFAGTLELRTYTDESGAPRFDVLTYAGDSGAVFRAGTTELVGAIAYGTVEMKDRRDRAGLQAALTAPVDVRHVPPVAISAAAPAAIAAPVEETLAEAVAQPEPEPTAVPTASPEGTTPERAKRPAAKRTAAEKTATEKVASKATAARETAVEKAAAKKTATKEAAAKKAASKATATKKAASKATAAKKAASKATAAKKTATKKAASKATATKEAASKKTAAKKAASKKTATKKTATKKTATKKTATKKTATKKAAAR